MTENNSNINYAIRLCVDTDDKIKVGEFKLIIKFLINFFFSFKNSRSVGENRDLIERYQNAIAVLLPYVKGTVHLS